MWRAAAGDAPLPPAALCDTGLVGTLAHLPRRMRGAPSGACTKPPYKCKPHFTTCLSEKPAAPFARKARGTSRGAPADLARSALAAPSTRAVFRRLPNRASAPEGPAGWFLATLKIA